MTKERGLLVQNGQLRKVIDSYGLFRSATQGAGDSFEQAVSEGKIELEVYPMGTLAEKYRAAGAGIPAFYTPTGIGSVFEEMKATNVNKRHFRSFTTIWISRWPLSGAFHGESLFKN